MNRVGVSGVDPTRPEILHNGVFHTILAQGSAQKILSLGCAKPELSLQSEQSSAFSAGMDSLIRAALCSHQ